MSDNLISILTNESKAIEVSNISLFVEDVNYFKDLSFNIDIGSITGIVGPPEAGKTILLKTLAGLYKPKSGSINVMGYSSEKEVDAVRSLIGVATDTSNLYPNLSIIENLSFFAKLNGMNGSEAMERSSFLLHKLNMWKVRETKLEKTNTELQKKTLVLSALLTSPKVLLLDSPASSFDNHSREQLNQVILELADLEGITVLYTSREPEDLPPCDNYIILNQGKCVAKGTVDDIKNKAHISKRAHIEIIKNNTAFAGLDMEKISDTVYEKNIEDDIQMAELVKKAVYWGFDIVKADVYKPTLSDYYYNIIEQTTEDIILNR